MRAVALSGKSSPNKEPKQQFITIAQYSFVSLLLFACLFNTKRFKEKNQEKKTGKIYSGRCQVVYYFAYVMNDSLSSSFKIHPSPKLQTSNSLLCCGQLEFHVHRYRITRENKKKKKKKKSKIFRKKTKNKNQTKGKMRFSNRKDFNQ